MKKKKLNTLNIFGGGINSDVALSRKEMKKIMAGSGGNVCRIYSGGSWGGCSWTVSEAQSWYNNHPGVSGYCCASCASMCY